MIIKQLEIGYMDNFCYIVGCEKTRKALVIDPGHDVDRIVSVAEKQGLEIETIVNTHTHGDHTAGNAELKSLTGAKIIIHALDAAGYPTADVLLKDEKILQLGEITFDVIHTPGHTPGGICSMRREISLRATPFLSATAAAPTCPAAIAPPWANPSPADATAGRYHHLAGPRLRPHTDFDRRLGKATQCQCQGIRLLRERLIGNS